MKRRLLHLTSAFGAVAILLGSMSGSVSAQPPSMRSTQPQTSPSNPDLFGKTNDFDGGRLFENNYTHGFYCDTSIPAGSSSGCEVGTTFKNPPSSQFDPLYITVPLGFNSRPMRMQCPNAITCIDHPPTIDLSAIGGPANAATPGHDHYTTTTFRFRPEWWNVVVIGVTSRSTWDKIKAHGSFEYIAALLKRKDPTVTAPIPTNLFLFFAVEPPGAD